MYRKSLITSESLTPATGDNANNTLSYDMVFEEMENSKQKKFIPEEEVLEMLQEKDDEWMKRVKLEQHKSHRLGYEKGAEDGFERGYNKAIEDARQEINTSLSAFEGALNAIEQSFEQFREEVEPGVASLIFALAEKVIGVPMESEKLKKRTIDQIESFFHKMDESYVVRVHCAEADRAAIEDVCSNFDLKKITIKPNPSFNPGEYQIEHDLQQIVNDFKKGLHDLRENIPVEDWFDSQDKTD